MSSSISNFILHLSLIEKVGPSHIQKILDQLPHYEIDHWYRFGISDFMKLGISELMAGRLVNGLASKKLLDKELELIQSSRISWMTILDPEYPHLLKNIHLPPPILYYRGLLPADQNQLAVVGSRDATQYGYDATQRIVAPLAQQGWAIISGGAIGIDAIAHKVTLENGGVTAAILGSGLLNVYPRENFKLFNQIVENRGALISSFPLLMESLPQNFPARNRIISGMSRGCLVVQAAAKSGARITADFCLAQGREVFAVPGPFDSTLSAGCHELIQQGAKLTTCTQDILKEFGQEVKPVYREEKVMVLPIFDAPRGVEGGDPQEQAIIKACSAPSSMDELMEQTGIPLIELTHLLFNLQIKGKICQNMAGLWEKP